MTMTGYSLRGFLVAAAVLAIIAGVHDYRARRIPNWLTLTAIVGGIVAHAWMGYSLHGSSDFAIRSASLSAMGALVVGCVPLLLWRFGVMGGGDVKVIAAIGAVCHASVGMTIVFTALVMTICFFVMKLSWEGTFWRSFGNGLLVLANPVRKKERRVRPSPALSEGIAFGPPLALSAVGFVILQGGL